MKKGRFILSEAEFYAESIESCIKLGESKYSSTNLKKIETHGNTSLYFQAKIRIFFIP